jgi:membrane-anchored protein YejM (alkaline phosphatase superfamily)
MIIAVSTHRFYRPFRAHDAADPLQPLTALRLVDREGVAPEQARDVVGSTADGA